MKYRYLDEILVVSVAQIESLAHGFAFENFQQKLLAYVDIAAVEFGTVVGWSVQLLSQPHWQESIQLQYAQLELLQLH